MEALGPSCFSPPNHKSKPNLGWIPEVSIPPGPEDCNRLHLRRDACCLTCAGLGGSKNQCDDRARLPTLPCLHHGLSSPRLPSSTPRSNHIHLIFLENQKKSKKQMGILLPFAFSHGPSPRRLAGLAVPWCPRCLPGRARGAGGSGTRLTPGHSRTLTAF